ncbi:MAG: chemotaxis protein CheD [Deltaproteobacteria bacterium]|nr:chemotaxis protein CheD [Deltaproteobacteria bacterium]
MQNLKRITVSISDMKITNDQDALLITHSLGSCIGLLAYDTKIKLGGLLHFQLPDSANHGARAKENPFMFADTGIPLMLEKMYAKGADRNRMKFGIFGGASMLDDEQLFKIGVKNARASKKILWQHAITVDCEDIGGNSSRTVSLEIGTGKIGLRKDGKLFDC